MIFPYFTTPFGLVEAVMPFDRLIRLGVQRYKPFPLSLSFDGLRMIGVRLRLAFSPELVEGSARTDLVE